MKYSPRQRVLFKSLVGQRMFSGHILYSLKDGFYMVEDDTGRPPRPIHHNRLILPQKQVPHGVFA